MAIDTAIPSGLLSFPLTPFTADGDPALDVLATHLEDQLQVAPGAMFVACGTGEGASLDADEFSAVVRRAVEVVAGRVPVWVGAGGGLGTARTQAAIAAHAGADGLLLMPPYLVQGPEAGVVAHVRAVATTSGLPIVVYRRGTAKLGPSGVLALLDIPTVLGLKDGFGDLEVMTRVVSTVRTSGHARAETFAFLNGLPTAELSAAAYRGIGVHDYSSAVLCFAPDIARAFHTALGAGDTATVDALLSAFYLPLAELRDTTAGYAVALVKAGARQRGVPVGPVRPPLVEATPDHAARLSELVTAGRAVLAREGVPVPFAPTTITAPVRAARSVEEHLA